VPSPYLEQIGKFRSNLTYLENQALLRLNEEVTEEFPEDLIKDAYDYLMKDILAALQLGKISYLESNLTWVEGLLESRQFEAGYLKKYLQSLIAVSREVLGSEAKDVLDKLEGFIENIQPQGG
jgi:hypothetical protein